MRGLPALTPQATTRPPHQVAILRLTAQRRLQATALGGWAARACRTAGTGTGEGILCRGTAAAGGMVLVGASSGGADACVVLLGGVLGRGGLCSLCWLRGFPGWWVVKDTVAVPAWEWAWLWSWGRCRCRGRGGGVGPVADIAGDVGPWCLCSAGARAVWGVAGELSLCRGSPA